MCLFFFTAFYSCKKVDTPVLKDNISYAEKFFEKPAASSAELQTIIDLLKTENDKTGFVNKLPDNAGLPMWGKLIVEKPNPKPGYSARGIIADKNGNMLIPLSNDNKTLSAILLAIKKDDKYEFYYYDNNYAYRVAFSIDKYTIKQREMVMGLFMAMSNYVFGTKDFKNIPNDLFPSFVSKPEENGITKKVFLMLGPGSLPDIFIAGNYVNTNTAETCFWQFTGTCNCAGSNNTPQKCDHPTAECPTSTCTKQVCYSLIFEDYEGPGTDSPEGNLNGGVGEPVAFSSSNWSNGIDGGSAFPDASNGNLPNAPWSWEQKSYAISFEPGGIIVLDVIGNISYNVFLEGIGTILKEKYTAK